MSRTVFVNGRYLPYAHAAIHVEDRGFQFADSIYEVMEVRDRKLVDERRHMARLSRSAHELGIKLPMALSSLGAIMRETIRRNKIGNGSVYLQITRGAACRDFVFPDDAATPTIVCIARPKKRKAANEPEEGIHVITMPDIRWRRPDIKSTALLPNVLARQSAREAGANEAWLVDDKGYITEGAASNAWIVTRHNQLQTRPADDQLILRGITRTVVIDIAQSFGWKILEKPFTVAEALAASEAFTTAATALITPIARINGQVIGTGKVGPIVTKLRDQFHNFAEISH